MPMPSYEKETEIWGYGGFGGGGRLAWADRGSSLVYKPSLGSTLFCALNVCTVQCTLYAHLHVGKPTISIYVLSAVVFLRKQWTVQCSLQCSFYFLSKLWFSNLICCIKYLYYFQQKLQRDLPGARTSWPEPTRRVDKTTYQKCIDILPFLNPSE
jgi:hypothetical protein